jgi:NTP pyrophosphatase (non-canonical NTP hydrolase)
MQLNDYQQKAIATLTSDYVYGDITPQPMGCLLGLSDESGEVLGKVKKLLRDKQGKLSDEDKQEIVKELGDVLWYVASTSNLLGSSLDEVAQANVNKLASRQARDVLHGSGDNR